MPFNDRFDDGHAQAHGGFALQAGSAGTAELFEQCWVKLFGYADAGIRNADEHLLVFLSDPDSDGAAVGGELDSIRNQVVDNLHKLFLVDVDIDMRRSGFKKEGFVDSILRDQVFADKRLYGFHKIHARLDQVDTGRFKKLQFYEILNHLNAPFADVLDRGYDGLQLLVVMRLGFFIQHVCEVLDRP